MSSSTVPVASGANSSLHAAKSAKNDEFYTQLTDIEKELQHYKGHFKGKVVFCNCDDPEWSNFWKYFTLKFGDLKLAKVISTHYAPAGGAYKLEYFGVGEPVKTMLDGTGDFRSPECAVILAEADIVVTNPPFSLFREYVAQLVAAKKQFLIVGNNNAITYKEIFPLIKANLMWLGHSANKTIEFQLSASYSKWDRVDSHGNKFGKVPAVSWFTNLPHKKRNDELALGATYTGHETDYPKYDNYDAIEVSKVALIPCDYAGCMGVPITFLEKFNPAQFEIIGISKTWFNFANKQYPPQVQIGATGKESLVTKLNDGAVIKVTKAPADKTHYRIGTELFIQLYARVLIKRKGAQA